RAGARAALREARNRTGRLASALHHPAALHLLALPEHVGARLLAEFLFIEVGAERARPFQLLIEKAPAAGGERAVVVVRKLAANAGGVTAILLPRRAENGDVHIHKQRGVAFGFALVMFPGHL